MSFSGDLEHLPLIDIIQVLQQTGKSGTLRLTGDKGECQLGFREGFIVSANHVNTGYRIGSILVELGAVTREALDLTLAEQVQRGPHPPPLIAMLVETGRVKREEAYRGLQTLIELTIVEVLTWPHGRFELDVEKILVSDEYRYFPDHNEAPPQISTQSVLMEALRIFDEKKRDGTLENVADAGGPRDESLDGLDGLDDLEGGGAGAAVAEVAEVESISADDLGLADVESLKRVLPRPVTIPEERREDEVHRRRIRRELEDLPADDQERLVSFLMRIGAPPLPEEGPAPGEGLALVVLLFTGDKLFSHTVTTGCAVRNIFVFATDEPQDLTHIIEQSLARDRTPLLVLDVPGDGPGQFSEASTNETMQAIRVDYPALRFIRLVDRGQDDLALRALTAGALATLPKPNRSAHPSSFVGDFIRFAEALLCVLRQAAAPPGRVALGEFRENLAGLSSLTKPSDVSLSLLQYVGSMFPRALTLLVPGDEVVIERSIGLDGSRAVAPALKHHVPIDRPSVLATVIDGGVLYYGQAPEEPTLRRLFDRIDEPRSPKIAVIPLKTGSGRVVALAYGDFGEAWATPVPIELLDIFARHAGLVLDTLSTQAPGQKGHAR